ncbi:unnamed protein product, partial [Prorocentrum cordatum]
GAAAEGRRPEQEGTPWRPGHAAQGTGSPESASSRGSGLDTPATLLEAPRRLGPAGEAAAGSLAAARDRFKVSVNATARSSEFQRTKLLELDAINNSPTQCKDLAWTSDLSRVPGLPPQSPPWAAAAAQGRDQLHSPVSDDPRAHLDAGRLIVTQPFAPPPGPQKAPPPSTAGRRRGSTASALGPRGLDGGAAPLRLPRVGFFRSSRCCSSSLSSFLNRARASPRGRGLLLGSD